MLLETTSFRQTNGPHWIEISKRTSKVAKIISTP